MGKLMKERPAASSPMEPSSKSASLSPGMGVLLRGGNGMPKKDDPDQDSHPVAPRSFKCKRLIQGALLLADLVLLALAARLALKANGPLGGTDLLFCFVALVLGAGLTCLAFGWDRLTD